MAKRKVKRKSIKQQLDEDFGTGIESPSSDDLPLAPIETPSLAEFLSQRAELRERREGEFELSKGAKKALRKVTRKRK